jgi:hypothetical protein
LYRAILRGRACNTPIIKHIRPRRPRVSGTVIMHYNKPQKRPSFAAAAPAAKRWVRRQRRFSDDLRLMPTEKRSEYTVCANYPFTLNVQNVLSVKSYSFITCLFPMLTCAK